MIILRMMMKVTTKNVHDGDDKDVDSGGDLDDDDIDDVDNKDGDDNNDDNDHHDNHDYVDDIDDKVDDNVKDVDHMLQVCYLSA